MSAERTMDAGSLIGKRVSRVDRLAGAETVYIIVDADEDTVTLDVVSVAGHVAIGAPQRIPRRMIDGGI